LPLLLDFLELLLFFRITSIRCIKHALLDQFLQILKLAQEVSLDPLTLTLQFPSDTQILTVCILGDRLLALVVLCKLAVFEVLVVGKVFVEVLHAAACLGNIQVAVFEAGFTLLQHG